MGKIHIRLQPSEEKMYVCRDIYNGFGLPFGAASDQMAKRAFKYYCVVDPEGQAKAAELEVYYIGKFNRDTADFKKEPLKLIDKGVNYVQNSLQRKNKIQTTSRK